MLYDSHVDRDSSDHLSVVRSMSNAAISCFKTASRNANLKRGEGEGRIKEGQFFNSMPEVRLTERLNNMHKIWIG